MKHLIILNCLFSIFALTVYAQPAPNPKDDAFDVLWGAEYKFPKKHMDLGYVGNLHDGFIQVSIRFKKDVVLQGFNAKLKTTKETKIDIKKWPKSIMSEGFFYFDSRYYWFYSTWNKKDKKEQLYMQEIDVTGVTFRGSPVKLVESDKLTGDGYLKKGMYSFEVTGKYKFNTSADSSKLLITYRKYPKERDDSKNKDKLGFYVFNSSLEKQWGKEIKMPYTEEKMDNIDFDVDSTGNAFLLAKVFKTNRKEKTKTGKPNYDYEILGATADSKELTKIPVTLKDNFVNDILITDDINGNILCAGLYSKNTSNHSGSDGVFLTKIDTSGNFVDVHKGYYEFPAEILKQYESKRTKKKVDKKEGSDDAEATNLELRNVIVEKDGSVLITGEEYYVTSTTTYNTGAKGTTQRTTYTYHYDDILAMKIAASGEMEWVYKIPKRQAYSSQYYSGVGSLSFKMFSNNGNVYFIYIDNMKNLKLKPEEVPVSWSAAGGQVFVYSKIDKEGNLTKGKILDRREEKIRMTAVDFQRVGKNELINRATRRGYSKAILFTEQTQ